VLRSGYADVVVGGWAVDMLSLARFAFGRHAEAFRAAIPVMLTKSCVKSQQAR
jgi:hypothetical protein